MSEPNEPKKIPVDTLLERAWTWWDNQDWNKENIVVKEYMKEHNITDDQVEW